VPQIPTITSLRAHHIHPPRIPVNPTWLRRGSCSWPSHRDSPSPQRWAQRPQHPLPRNYGPPNMPAHRKPLLRPPHFQSETPLVRLAARAFPRHHECSPGPLQVPRARDPWVHPKTEEREGAAQTRRKKSWLATRTPRHQVAVDVQACETEGLERGEQPMHKKTRMKQER